MGGCDRHVSVLVKMGLLNTSSVYVCVVMECVDSFPTTTKKANVLRLMGTAKRVYDDENEI